MTGFGTTDRTYTNAIELVQSLCAPPREISNFDSVLQHIADIDTEAPLFGEGLGLDSIDALELGLALKKRYNIHLNAESDETKQHFKSIQSLVALVEAQQKS